jgi:hypothetical protein
MMNIRFCIRGLSAVRNGNTRLRDYGPQPAGQPTTGKARPWVGGSPIGKREVSQQQLVRQFHRGKQFACCDPLQTLQRYDGGDRERLGRG